MARLASIALVLPLVVGGCAALPGRPRAAPSDPEAPLHLRLIGQRTLDHRLAFGGTVVGGLSGIDYDAASGLYYLVSDDRSQFSPTRFYSARLDFDAEHFGDARLMSVVTLRRPDGSRYPPAGSDDAADAEAIRVDPTRPLLWWTSEGARADTPGRGTDPFVRASDLAGRFVDALPVDPMFRVSREQRGPRDNRAFEGLTFSADGRSLWVAMEGPLIEDGPMPTTVHGALVRLSRHDRGPDGRFGPMAAQLAYPLDPVPPSFAPMQRHALNGLSEILAFDRTRLLVLERAFVAPSGWHIRLYVADTGQASDVRDLPSLATASEVEPMTKRLVLDFDALDVVVDNLEGLCFGPTLANGHRTLVFVSDDNFNPGEKTQLLAFEVLPGPAGPPP